MDSNMNNTDILENQTNLFLFELLSINRFWDRLESVYQPLELGIYLIGILGNFLALLTLIRSKKMCTPSFSYHRALVITEFLYCANYLLHIVINRYLQMECRENVYRFWIAAFITGVLNPALSSVFNYILHYITTVIALDRVLALHFVLGYLKWNRPMVALWVITLATVVSLICHSWAAFVQMEVNEFGIGDKEEGSTHQLLISYPCWNDSVVYYSVKRENITRTVLGEALKIKDIYNGIFRIAYSILLTVLTLAVIAGLIKRRKQRDSNGRSVVSFVSIFSDTTSFTVDRKYSTLEQSEAYFATSSTLDGRGRRKRKLRASERLLFVLMIAVLLLAFFQVAASESSRILQMFYPPTELTRVLSNESRSVEEKLAYLRISMYSHFYARILSRACTAVERSFVCILYIAMNAIFRQELLVTAASLCLRLLWSTTLVFSGIGGKKRDGLEPGETVIQLTEYSKNRLIVVGSEPLSGYSRRSVIVS